MSSVSHYGKSQSPASGYQSPEPARESGSADVAPSPYRREGGGSAARPGPAQVRRPKPAAKPRPAPEKRTLKKEWKAVKDGPHQPTRNIYFLFYLGTISRNYSFEDYINYLHGSADPIQWSLTSPFEQRGVSLTGLHNGDTFWNDLGRVLHEPGAVVIYMGHSERGASSRKARNLRPRTDPSDGSADLSVRKLAQLTKTMNAKCFILASCATDGCIGKSPRDTVLVTTHSDKNLTTDALNWSAVLAEFLAKFIDDATITGCLAAANAVFAKSSEPNDKFVQVSGAGAMTGK